MKLIVPNAETALRIFEVIEEHLSPLLDREKYAKTVVQEKSDRWLVFRGSTDETVFGGGQLTMEIAKCDGAVSAVSMSR